MRSPEEDEIALEEAIEAALEENQLPGVYRRTVRELIDQPEAEWPMCCGTDCDPCVLSLQRAATRARQIAAKKRQIKNNSPNT